MAMCAVAHVLVLALALCLASTNATVVENQDNRLAQAAAAAASAIVKAKAAAAAGTVSTSTNTVKAGTTTPATVTSPAAATKGNSVSSTNMAASALLKKLNISTGGSAAMPHKKPTINFAKLPRSFPPAPFLPPQPPSPPPAAIPIRGRDKITPPNPQEIFPALHMLLAACPDTPAPGMTMQVVLAMAENMGTSAVCPLVRSWRTNSPDARIVLFTDNMAMRTSFMDAVGAVPNVQVVYTKAKPPKGVSWSVWRFWVFQMYFSMCASRLQEGAIAITDANDALALGDVFNELSVKQVVENNGVLFTLDGNPGQGGSPSLLAVKDHPATFAASKACFSGMSFPIEMLGGPVSSNGLVVGSANAMKQYVDAMVSGFMDWAGPECVKQHGADQAIHTMIMNVGEARKLVNFTITRLHNGVSPYYSMKEARPVTMDMFGVFSVIRGTWGFHPVYIHGYDRDPYMAAEVPVLFDCAIAPPTMWGQIVHSSKRMGENKLLMLAIGFSVVVLASLGCALGVSVPALIKGRGLHAK